MQLLSPELSACVMQNTSNRQLRQITCIFWSGQTIVKFDLNGAAMFQNSDLNLRYFIHYRHKFTKLNCCITQLHQKSTLIIIKVEWLTVVCKTTSGYICHNRVVVSAVYGSQWQRQGAKAIVCTHLDDTILCFHKTKLHSCYKGFSR